MSRPLPPPPRPNVPVTLYVLAAAVATCRAVMGAAAPVEISFAIGSAALALTACAALAGRLRSSAWAPAACAALVACALAAGAAGMRAAQMSACADALASSPVSSWSFELEGDMSAGPSLWRGKARAHGPKEESCLVWLTSEDELARGSRIACVGRFSPAEDDEWGRSSRMQGICGTVRLVRTSSVEPARGVMGSILGLRAAAVASIECSGIDPRVAALLEGSVCGSTAALKSEGLDEVFSACGASHLVAVSGGHLVLISSMAAAALDRARLRPWAKAFALALLTGSFVLFCGAPASAVRSWTMSVVAAGSALLGRRGHPLSSACAVGCAMALLDPAICGDMGFCLSVLCVVCIGLFGSYARHAVLVVLGGAPALRSLPEPLRRPVKGLLGSATDALSLTLVCQAASIPVTVPAFGAFSLIAPVANVAVGWLFTLLLGLGVAGAALAPVPALQRIVLWAAQAPGLLIVRILEGLAKVPMASVAVDAEAAPLALACLAAGVALLVAWPQLTRRRIAAALAVAVIPAAIILARWRFFAPARVCVMDVGQADAILVADGASSLLVDAGLDSRVAAALARNHALHLDAVVLTHLDEDHVGGLDDLAGAVDVGAVYVARGVADRAPEELCATARALTGAGLREVSLGDVLRVGGFDLRVVWPREEVKGDENADSVMLALGYEGRGGSLTGLLAGDAERDQTASVLAAGGVGDVDFLKVGHHGSKASIAPEQAEALSPEVAVASAGEGNSYGHPSAECVEALGSAGALFLCTKDVGDVVIEPGEAGPRVTAQRVADAVVGGPQALS